MTSPAAPICSIAPSPATANLRCERRDRRVCLDRGRSRPCPRHRRHHPAGPPASRANQPAESLRQDSRHCIAAIRTMIAEGRSINITLAFSLSRYDEVIEAYLSGLEAFAATGGALGSGRASDWSSDLAVRLSSPAIASRTRGLHATGRQGDRCTWHDGIDELLGHGPVAGHRLRSPSNSRGGGSPG